MATKRQQTMAKRTRELAVKEKRDRKRAKRAEAAEMRAAGIDPAEHRAAEREDLAAPDSAPGELAT